MDFQGAIGNTTPLSSLTIPSATNVLVNANAALSGPFTITAATGPTTFNGSLSASAISINGAAMNFNNAVNTSSGSIALTNSGTLTIASSSPITSATSFTQTGAGSVSLGSNITTAGTLSVASAITLTNGVTLNSGGGNLTLSSTVAGVFNLTLTAGAGDVTLSGAIGAPRIGVFTVTSAHNISVQAITASAISQLSGTGTSTLNGSLNTNTIAGITLVGTTFISSGTITTTNGGPLTVTNSGLLTGTGANTITLDGAFTQNGTGPVNTGGTITTNNANISHTGAVSVLLPATFTSNGGNILFSNTVNGPACLTLAASTGNVTFSAAVGATTPLGCLTASGATLLQSSSLASTGAVQETASATIQLGGNLTTNANDITLTGNTVIAASLTLSTSGGAGNISISGTVNGNVAGRNLTIQTGTGNITLSNPVGANTSFNNLTLSANNISVANLGSTVVAATGTTSLNATTSINFTGTTYKSGTQSYTAGTNFNFTAGVATAVTSNALPITFTTGTIHLSNDLTLDSNGGTLTMGHLLGTGFNFTADADVGTYNFVQIGAAGQLLNNVNLTANTFNPTPVNGSNVFATSLVVSSSTPVTLSVNQLTGAVTYDTPIVFQGNITYSCGAAGTITFNKSVNAFTAGVDTLTFNFSPCTGSVVFNGPVGSTAPLASLSINLPTDVTVNSTMNVGAFTVTNGTNSVSINSGLTSTAAGGISIATSLINLTGSISTASAGPLVLANSGTLTIGAGASFDISGAFQQTGAGAVTMGGSVITHDSTIQFAGPITLTGDMTFNSNVLTGGDISFASTIQGAQNLTIAAGGHDVTFGAAVGTLATPLTSLQITSARNVTASATIFANTITQLAGTGLTSLSTLNTNALNGINLTGSAFTFNNNVTTTGGGPLRINNSGILTFANATYSIAGALTQTGSGSTTMAGTFSIGGAISFAQGVTLTGTTSLNTSSNGQNILFSSTLNNDNLGAHNLTLNAGTGSITLSGTVGATPIGVLTISNANNVAAGAISATSIAQSAGTGTTSINGNLTTSGVAGISLIGTNFTLNSTVTTTSLGPFSITNSGPLSLALGNSTSITGAFTQSGGGAVSLSGTVATVNQNLSFANAITLAGSTTLSTGAGAGTITLSSTVNGNQSFSLTAGTGNIVFGANLGATTPIGAFTVSSVNNITYPLVNAASIVQSASTGTTTITGPFSTTGALGVAISGGAINQNGVITTINAGSVSFTNTGTLTIGVGVTTAAAGGYTQSGGGAVSLGGSISTTNNPISFAGATTLTADITLNAGPTSSNGANISFASTIQGAHALTLMATGGSIALSGNVGTVGTPLTGFTITDANLVSTQGIISTFISQAAGTGTTTFNGALSATTITGISLTGTAFTFNSTFTTAAAGPLTVSNTGLLTFAAGATGSVSGALTQSSTGSTQLSSSITAGGAMQFNGPFTVSGTGSLSTSAANQPITFLSTLNGPGNLTLSSGTADILLSANAGSLSSLGALTVSTVRNLTAQAITATSLTQSAGTGTSLFNGNVSTTGSGGIHLTGSAFTFLQNVTTTGTGPITITNSGTLTTTSGKTFSSNGVFTQNGSGSVLLGSTITTTNATAVNAAINFSGTSPITLTAPSNIDSSIGGGTITFSSANTVDGHQAITMNAGTGDINILGNFGGITRLGAVTVTSVNNLQFQAVTAASILQSAGSGTTSLLGAVDTNTPAGMTFIGNNFTTGPFAMTVNTTNGGSVVLTNQGLISGAAPVVVTVDGSWIQNGPGPVFIGSVTARQGISFTGPGVIAASGTLDSSGGGGNIVLSNVIGGLAGTENLVLNAGIGNITFSQSIGAVTMIGSIPVTALGSITATGNVISIANVGTALAKGVNGTIALTASGGMNFTGTTYHGSTQTYTATTAFPFNMNAGALTTFSSDGAVMSFSGGTEILLSTGTDLTMNTGGANLTLGVIHAQAGNHRALILNAGAGTIQAGNIGTQGAGEFASASFTGANLTLGHEIADSFTFNYTGTLHATGDITSTDTALIFPSTVVLDATNTFSTVGVMGAGITFSGTVDGLADDAFGLTLNAGIGSISFAQNVGMTHRLSNVTINSALNVTLAAPATMIVDSLFQFTGFGTTTFNGTLVVPSVIGISLTGTNFSFNNFVQTLSNGSLTVTNSGILTFAGSASLSGAFTQTGTGSVALSGSITAGQPISISGATTLSGNPSLDTSAANQTITFQNTLNGSGNLTLASGGGDIILQSNAGLVSRIGTITVNSSHNITAQSVSAAAIHVVSSTGTATINGAINTNGAAGLILVGNNFTLNGSLVTTNGGSVVLTNSGLVTGFAINSRTVDGSYTQNGTGPVNFAGSLTTHTGPISFASPVTLLAASVFDSSASNSNITFSNTIQGPGNLSVSAGGGNILFSQDLGDATGLGAVVIPTAHNVTTQVVNAASLTQTAGSGTTTFNGNLTTNGTSGVSLTGTNFIRGANWTTTNSGPITVNNSGLFTSTAAGTIVSAGAFNQSGAGAVSISGSLTTANAAINFTGPMTLAGNMSFNTGTGPGSMTFNNTVDAALDSTQTLTLASGSGNISFLSGVGSGTRLGNVTVSSANNVTFTGLRTTRLSQTAGSGTTTLNGTTNTSAAGGIQILTSGITLNGTIVTTSSGPVILTNGGLLTVAANCTVAGAFTQNGLGTSSVSGSVTASGPIFFTTGVATSGSPSLTTSSQLITLSSTLNGPGNLSLNSGAANTILGGAAGGTTRLGALTFTNANNITAGSITAGSITQVSGAGTTTITGNLNTNGASGIHLTGTSFALNGSIITTASGPVVINHTAASSFVFGPSTLISGPFSEIGTGTISLSGILHANTANITFTNAINLTNATTLDSDGVGDILITSTVDGAQDLDLIAGGGSINILAAIGSTTPIHSFTIESANDVTTQAISAGFIVQSAGTGLSSFNGALATTSIAGINLTGNQFTFNAPVSTLGNGPVRITNSGLCTIALGAPFTLSGDFSQLGLGTVSLADNFTLSGNSLLFTGAVTLANNSTLNTGLGTGNMTFLSTVSGLHNFNLSADFGTITFSQNVGTINNLQVNSAGHLSAQAITASSINLSGISTLATLNGSLSTSGVGGITLSGAGFTVLGTVTTGAGGPLTITNSGLLTFSPNIGISLDGHFLQNGSGSIFGGGTLTTNNQTVEFQSLFTLTGNLSINSGTTGANVTLAEMEGAFDLTIAAGTGDVALNQVLGDDIALHNFTVSTAHDIHLSGIGTAVTGITGALNLTASNNIILNNTIYSANTQIYSAANEVLIDHGLQTNLTSFGGPITFTSGTIVLGDANDLQVITNNGSFSFVGLLGTNFENIVINTGTGTAALGVIASLGTINNLFVTAGKITISGPIDPINTNFVSLTDIMNIAGPVLITCHNTPSFNALGGDVGSLTSPILVHSDNQIFAGADGHKASLADFNGTSFDNTVHAIPSNPPCTIIFNGVVIKECTISPVPTPFVVPIKGFPTPGFDDSQYNLSSDFYFLPYFIDRIYFQPDPLMNLYMRGYRRAKAKPANRTPFFRNRYQSTLNSLYLRPVFENPNSRWSISQSQLLKQQDLKS